MGRRNNDYWGLLGEFTNVTSTIGGFLFAHQSRWSWLALLGIVQRYADSILDSPGCTGRADRAVGGAHLSLVSLATHTIHLRKPQPKTSHFLAEPIKKFSPQIEAYSGLI